ncbi:uncharacterized protein LOC123449196 isoform X2 [Hordeum vulgare subsp. vulgare]|uniref:uncharacterized protein LOC123449196 isoform X2 n=1 Tax=Hordeum vulgare subsp. vulgare TaxID=112509 RepID=UPI001D1A47DE|nr:uncharacterized protein LOC123449196 isoform X2 [Hordeum vulgare subsp. vulgare]
MQEAPNPSRSGSPARLRTLAVAGHRRGSRTSDGQQHQGDPARALLQPLHRRQLHHQEEGRLLHRRWRRHQGMDQARQNRTDCHPAYLRWGNAKESQLLKDERTNMRCFVSGLEHDAYHAEEMTPEQLITEEKHRLSWAPHASYCWPLMRRLGLP